MDQNIKKLISIETDTKTDDLFTENRKWISSFSKDDGNLGFVTLKKKLEQENIFIKNFDYFKLQSKPDIEIHFAKNKTYLKKNLIVNNTFYFLRQKKL